MWKSLRSTSHGGKSVRSIVALALAVLLTVFFAATSLSTSYAASDDATWNGSSIMYKSEQFTESGTSAKGDTTGIPAGNTYYEASDKDGKSVDVIYYDKDADTSKPVDATYAVYTLDDSTTPPSLEKAHDTKKITIDGGDQTPTSCAVAGVGWMVCSLSNFIAGGMDDLFGLLTQFVKVTPINITSTANPLFIGWNLMRGIANLAFIVVFLLIIYSQVTSIGLNNYSLKKLLPRLIIAAILVNISYYLAAACVDLSNIVGSSVQGFFTDVGKSVFYAQSSPANPHNLVTWKSLTAFVLSGGTAAVVGGIALLTATGGTTVGLIFLILPALVGLMLTILVVILVLAARQALIVILIIIAPLAFVAYLLPNTEKWFTRWRELFTAMLIFFPAFSMVYAGAQLAGQIIIVNATSLVILILGMIVQLAPLVITPWLLKLSSGILGRVAALVHNNTKPARGGFKGWADRNREYHRQRGFGFNPVNEDGTRKFAGRARARYLAAGINNWNRRLEDNTKNAKEVADNMYHKTAGYEKIHREAASIAMDKEIIENQHKLHIQHELNTKDSTLHIKNVELEAGKIAVDAVMKQTAADIEEYKTGKVAGLTGNLARYNQSMRDNALAATVQARRAENAQHIQSEELRNALLASDALRMEAGGVAGIDGANSVLAAAVSAERQAYNKTVGEARAIIKHFNLSSAERQAFALGNNFKRDGLADNMVVDSSGHSFHFDLSNKYVREAAIEDQLATGTVDQINQIVMRSGSSLADFRTTISQAVAENKLGAKTIYLGGKTIDDIAQGRIKNMTDLKRVALETIAKGKIAERDLATADQDAVNLLASMAEAAYGNRTEPETASILSTIQATNPDLYADLGDSSAGRLVEFSKLARDTLLGDDRVHVKPNAKKHILRVARLTDPDFVEPDLPRLNDSSPDTGASPTENPDA